MPNSPAAKDARHQRFPCTWRDVLLVTTAIGLVVLLAFHIKANNELNGRAEKACSNRKAIAVQGNQSASDRNNLKAAFQIFLNETRRARGALNGTSYDPHFVRVIDTRIQPLLDRVRPFRVAPPRRCAT